MRGQIQAPFSPAALQHCSAADGARVKSGVSAMNPHWVEVKSTNIGLEYLPFL